MNDVTIIDRFLDTFSRYIDSGFGLLHGEVAFLTATLIVIDMTIAGLFWAMGHATGQGEDVIAKLIRKVLYVGAFAYIIGNFNMLASVVFRSFAGLGLTALLALGGVGEVNRSGGVDREIRVELDPVKLDSYGVTAQAISAQIAATNALSDVYAMGGEPWSAMNVAFFPQALAEDDPQGILESILRGGLDAMNEAGAVLAGGHTVQDDELKYGLAVTGIIDPAHMARNDGLAPGQKLLLTKPLGTGVLATAVKARWDGAEESEAEVARWCSRLNSVGGEVIRMLKIVAATDITGFGLGGHALEMAQASGRLRGA